MRAGELLAHEAVQLPVAWGHPRGDAPPEPELLEINSSGECRCPQLTLSGAEAAGVLAPHSWATLAARTPPRVRRGVDQKVPSLPIMTRIRFAAHLTLSVKRLVKMSAAWSSDLVALILTVSRTNCSCIQARFTR